MEDYCNIRVDSLKPTGATESGPLTFGLGWSEMRERADDLRRPAISIGKQPDCVGILFASFRLPADGTRFDRTSPHEILASGAGLAGAV
jgi:hypothetical protein